MRNWVAALDPKTGNMQWKTYSIPAPGEPGSETWKDKDNAWQTGGGAFYGTGSYDPATNLTYWGSGNPVPRYDSAYRPGDNLFTNSTIAFDAANGKIRWYFQYTPNDNRDYDDSGSHILIDTKVNGEDRKIARSPRPQRLQLHVRPSQRPVPQGRPIRRQGHLDQGHRRQDRQALDYDPGRTSRSTTRAPRRWRTRRARRVCPDVARRHQFLAVVLQPQDRHLYIPATRAAPWSRSMPARM